MSNGRNLKSEDPWFGASGSTNFPCGLKRIPASEPASDCGASTNTSTGVLLAVDTSCAHVGWTEKTTELSKAATITYTGEGLSGRMRIASRCGSGGQARSITRAYPPETKRAVHKRSQILKSTVDKPVQY